MFDSDYQHSYNICMKLAQLLFHNIVNQQDILINHINRLAFAICQLSLDKRENVHYQEPN